ncbi:MAG: 3D domain-containing protein [Phycisphaerales bacterium]|nr:3D domain-containing protein [Phycisphaerales bacterium]
MQEATALSPSRRLARGLVSVLPFIGLAALVSYSAILAKEAGRATPLIATDSVRVNAGLFETAPAFDGATPDEVLPVPQTGQPSTVAEAPVDEGASSSPTAEVGTRWFNGRPVRPARTIMMTVTAYSPDARSCGESADGITATLHSVWTNGFKLVAADPKVLPYGSMLSIAGYDNGQVVPVLDCGGAIKGRRLDVLFPTHEQARQWGIRKIPVVVWEYADGKPADDPRKHR